MVEPSSRKRVRTGCLTCRKRRRKCDETRPECANCTSKGLPCRYGTPLTFIASKLQDRLESSTATQTLPGPRSARAADRATVPATASTTGVRYLQPHHSVTSSESALVGPGLFALDSAPEIDPEHHPSATQTPLADINYARSGPARSRETHAEQSRLLKSPLVPSDGNTRRKKYELELFTHYRYHVAPILDLEIGSLSFGVQAVLDSMTLETTYHAILAVASSHRAAMGSSLQLVDEATSVTSAYLAHLQVAGTDCSSLTNSRILLLWRSLLSAPVESWSSLAPEILNQVHQSVDVLEQWQLLSRLHLAASLVETPKSNDVHVKPPPHATVDGREHGHLRQLCLALWLLEQILASLSPTARSLNSSTFPLAQTWLSQWQELQNWLFARSDDMRPILELGEDEISQFQLRESFSFPCITFSHASAVVANVAHHLASMMLLRRKPRLIKPVAGPGSSTSSLWHAQRVIGTVSAAADAQIWDPFLVAALSYAARQLSHDEQTQMVSKILRQIQTMSGLDLWSAIRNFGQPQIQ